MNDMDMSGYDTETGATTTSSAATLLADGGTVYYVGSTTVVTDFNPATDMLDLGTDSIHNQFPVDTPEGLMFLHMFDDSKSLLLEGVYLEDLTAANFAPVADAHLQQDLSAALAWENGTGLVRENTVYVRSHEEGLEEIVDFNPATDKISMFYLSVRGDGQLNFSVEETAEGVRFFSPITGQSLTLRDTTFDDLDSSHFEWRANQLEDNVAGRMGLSDAIDGFEYVTENIFSGKSVEMAGLVDRAPYHSQPDYTGTPIGSDGTDDDGDTGGGDDDGDTGGGDDDGDTGGGDDDGDTGGGDDDGDTDGGDDGDTDTPDTVAGFDPVIQSAWDSGYVVETSFTPEESVDGWTVQLRITGEITNIWNADILSVDGDIYTITAKDYNASVAAGQTISFGFQANGSDASVEVIGQDDTGDTDDGDTDTPPIGVTVTGGSTTEGDPGEDHVHDDGTTHVHDDGHRFIIFEVTLDEPATEEVTLTYTTADGTAVADTTSDVAWDYHETTGTLVFAPGEQTQIVTVMVHPDTIVEDTETFTFEVSGENITGQLEATGTIIDNDVEDPDGGSDDDDDDDDDGDNGGMDGGDDGGDGDGDTVTEGGDILNGPLSTVGTDIVDADGAKVDLKGVNWFGFETDVGAPHGLWARNMEDMLDEIADFGFNMIRLPFAGELATNGGLASSINTAENPELAGLTSLEVMGEFLDAAAERGIGVLLDMHRTTPGNGPEDGGTIPDVDVFLEQWAAMADMFGDHPAVIGFDLYNEPHGYEWDEWASIAEQAGNMLLESHPDELIIVEGVETYQGESHWWGGNLQGVADRPVELDVDNKLVYSPHEYATSVFEQPYFTEAGYDPETTLPQIFSENWGFIEEQGIAPLLVGEFGSTFESTIDQEWGPVLAEYLLDNDIDWSVWSWNPNSGDTGGVVLDDWETAREEAFTFLLDMLLAEAPDGTVDDGGDDDGMGDDGGDDDGMGDDGGDTDDTPVNVTVTGGYVTEGDPTDADHMHDDDDMHADGHQMITFEVTLAAPATEELTLTYATADGTAVADTTNGTEWDYHEATGELVFAVGEQTQTVTVLVHPDTLVENTETFTFTVSGENITGQLEATGIIYDNDVADDDGGDDDGMGDGEGTTYYVGETNVVTDFDPATDVLDVGGASIHNQIGVDTAEGFMMLHMFDDSNSLLLEGVFLADLTAANFAPIADAHLQQDLSASLAWENGTGLVRDNTVYVRSHEEGLEEIVDFNPATDKISMFYLSVRGDSELNFSVEETADGVRFFSPITGQSLTLRDTTFDDLDSSHFEWRANQLEDNVAGRMGLADAIDGFEYVTENIFSGKSVEMAGLVDRAPYHSQPEYTGTPIGSDGTDDDMGGMDDDATDDDGMGDGGMDDDTDTDDGMVGDTADDGSDSLDAQLSIVSDWGAGAILQLEITNTDGMGHDGGWELDLALDAQLLNFWDGDVADNGDGTVTVSSLDYNGGVSAGETVTVGFQIDQGGLNQETLNDLADFMFL